MKIPKPTIDFKHREITWTVHADNAPLQSGSILLHEIPVSFRKEEEDE